MFLVGLLCAQAVLGVEFASTLSSKANTWDANVNFFAGADKVLTGIYAVHSNDREDREFAFYTTQADGMTCNPGPWTDYKNSFDGNLDYQCGEGQALNAVFSYHDNGREDRRFKFKCCDITSGGKFKIHSVHQTHYLNDFDVTVNARCNPNQLLVGLMSYHSNSHEDRRWKIKCGLIQEVSDPIATVEPMGFDHIGSFNKYFAYTTSADMLIKMRAAWSENFCLESPSGDDNLVKMFQCDEGSPHQHFTYAKSTGQIKIARGRCLEAPGTVGNNRGTPLRLTSCNPSSPTQIWDYRASTGFIQQRGGFCLNSNIYNAASAPNTKVNMQPCDLGTSNHVWAMGSGGHKAINGMWSVHANGAEDRTFAFNKASMPGVVCNPSDFTELQNQYGGTLDFTCPTNQVMSGVFSVWNHIWATGTMDRRFSFKCCDVSASGFKITHIRNTGKANEWDGYMNIQCAANEVMVGMNAWFNIDRQDRVYKIKCGTLTENPPDYDDCSAVDVVDVEVGSIALGERRTVDVEQYTQNFNACGNSNFPIESTLTIESSQEVAATESLELSKSLDESFSFSTEIETTFTIGTEISAGIDLEVASASVAQNMEWGIRTQLGTDAGWTWGSSETKHTETGTVDVSVVSSQSVFEPAPYQWRQVRASYVRQEVIVPVRMKAQCTRKDGQLKTVWIDSKLKAAAFSQVDVEFLDRTKDCPQSYYKNCECVTGLQSDFIGDASSTGGCQAHPFMNAHPGCYVYKGAACGNGRGLGAAQPPSHVEICTDPARCPSSAAYVDFPLDSFVWEWSYMPCGGQRYYQGDPGYQGPEVEDLVLQEPNKQCYFNGGGSLGQTAYSNRAEAILECNRINSATPNTCYGVYDSQCDNVGNFYLCDNGGLTQSRSSCVWKMQDQTPLTRETRPRGDGEGNGFARGGQGVLASSAPNAQSGFKAGAAPAPAPAREPKTFSELFTEFGSDFFSAPLVG